MHAIKIYLLFLLFLQNVSALAQQPGVPKINIYEKDTLWKADVSLGIASLVELRTFLFEFNAVDKSAALSAFDAHTFQQIKDLDSLYQEEVLRIKNWFTRKAIEGARNQQAYSYLDVAIQLDKFFFYPDVYAILLNPVRQRVSPKIDPQTRAAASALIMSLTGAVHHIEPGGKNALMSIYLDFKQKYPESPHNLFQDVLPEEERSAYELINLMLWLSRSRS